MATQETPSQSKSIDEYRALYKEYLEYCNAHDLEAMRSFYATPIVVNDNPWTPEEATASFRPMIDAFPDWHWEMRNLTIQGDYLSLHFKVTGTHKGEFRGIKATGRKITTTQFTLYHVVGGKFAEVWDLVDFETLMEQIK
ncbi:aspartyl-tRNA synthetase [Fusarium austroafricanum]|uniref:Aspartyl-tRNA synthetase n=1 Tax=Fusarium austroafricanum TaxID=2364996 RepID=A0A8H4KA17_9HYPO|nr:aspartyl-tRNA synthetase [Fusarium austroafricanum]